MTSTNTKIIKRTGLTEPVKYKADDVFNAVIKDVYKDDVHTQLIAGDRKSGVTTTLMRTLTEILYQSGASDKPLTIGVVMPHTKDVRDKWVDFVNRNTYVSLKLNGTLAASEYIDVQSGSTVHFAYNTLNYMRGRRYDIIIVDQVDYVQNKIIEYACTGMFAFSVIMGATPSNGYITDKENEGEYFDVSRSYLIEPELGASVDSVEHALHYSDDVPDAIDMLVQNHPNLLEGILRDYVEQYKVGDSDE